MAVTPITPTELTLNTMSADILDADGTAATTQADGWAIAAGGNPGSRLLLKFFDDGSGGTVTFKAGDRPPSQRAGLGDLVITLAASDCRYICVEASRFLQDDGSIIAIASDAGAECTAFLLPAAG